MGKVPEHLARTREKRTVVESRIEEISREMVEILRTTFREDLKSKN